MGSFAILTSFFLLFTVVIVTKASSCNGPCETLNDCIGQLICINGKCNDDPQSGAQTCTTANDDRNCQSNGPYSPPYVPLGTRAILTCNDFGPGGDGGDASKCDEKFHPLPERVVALSTGWFDNRSRCGMKIRITTNDGRSTVATVVDECDSVRGCDGEHADQEPCKNNIVDASETVWNDLGLDTDKGEVAITWSMDQES